MSRVEEEIIKKILDKKTEHKEGEVLVLIEVLSSVYPTLDFYFDYCGENYTGNEYFGYSNKGETHFNILARLNWYTGTRSLVVGRNFKIF